MSEYRRKRRFSMTRPDDGPACNLMTTKQAAEMLGLSPRTLENWRVRGDGPGFVKVGRAVRYSMSDLVLYCSYGHRPHTSADF